LPVVVEEVQVVALALTMVLVVVLEDIEHRLVHQVVEHQQSRNFR
jgi:hypothetical protein